VQKPAGTLTTRAGGRTNVGGGRPMPEILQLPFTCHSCQHAFSVPKVDLDKNEPIYCPKYSAMFRLKSEQMKRLSPWRKPVRN
jgi:hypothetical protein